MVDCVFTQGCTYKPKFTITIDGKVPTTEDVAKIHFRLGNVIKTYPSNDITYEDGQFTVHLSSKDTLNIPAGRECEIEVVVVFPRGEIKPVKDIGNFIMKPTGFPSEVFLDE